MVMGAGSSGASDAHGWLMPGRVTLDDKEDIFWSLEGVLQFDVYELIDK